MIFIIIIHRIWNLICNAGNNRTYSLISPNNIPATQNCTPKSKRNFCDWFEHDPTMLRAWSEHEITKLNPLVCRADFFPFGNTFYIENQNTSCSGYLPKFHQMLHLPRKVRLQRRQALRLLPKVTLQYRQMLHLPRKMILQYDQMLHLPRKMTFMIDLVPKLLLYSAVTLLSCYFTEPLLYWAVTLLSCYFTELIFSWAITLLNRYFT